MRYKTGSLGGSAQDLIIDGGGTQEWKDALRKVGAGEKRISWMIDTIMFGEREYFYDRLDLQPLWEIHVEKIIDNDEI